MNEDINDPQTTEDSEIGPHRPDHPDFLTETSFEQFGLADEVLSGLEKAGFTHCTPIQAEVIPLGLEGKDVAGQAQTGTGKTAAFLVPIFNRLLEVKDRQAGLPSVLIIAPTRELAIQIYDDALVLGHYTGFTQGLVIGGIDYQRQADILTKGVDLVIGTPGRMIDYIKQGILKTTKISFLVVDEADRLLDMGFIKDLRYIFGKLPHYNERQTMLFSATLSYRALDSNPHEQDIPGILTYLGLAHKDLEDYDQAVELLTRSAELDDERRDTFNLLGFCYFKTKQHEKAIEAFEKVLKIDPGSGIDHANIGTNYREMGKTEEAIRYYKTALRLDPTLDWVQDNIAKLTI